MLAAAIDRYGPPEVVQVRDLPRPTPRADEVLVRVHAAAVTSADARIRGARFPPGFAPFARAAFGLRRPRRPILGSAFSGVVEDVGGRVERWAPGDRVCGQVGLRMGAHAEHVAVKADRLAAVPSDVDHDDAAGVVFGGTTALHFLRKASIGPGTTVLVNGAAGAVGTSAVQLARTLGAEVTGVCREANAPLVTGLGASSTIDHTVVDLADVDQRFDVVLDTVGTITIASGRAMLAEGGVLLLVVATLGETLRARGAVQTGTAPERVADVEHLLERVADGTLTVVVERTFALVDIVDAHRLVDSGRKVGNVLVHP